MGRGGRRKGAGRPKGTGKFGEPTKAVRLPVSLIDQTLQFVKSKGFVFPMHNQSDAAGALTSDSRRVKKLDLGKSFADHAQSFQVVVVEEDALVGDGIMPGDYLLVDTAIVPQNDDVVVAVVNGKTVVRWFAEKARGIELKGSSAKTAVLKFDSIEDLPFCGVVRKVLRDFYPE